MHSEPALYVWPPESDPKFQKTFFSAEVYEKVTAGTVQNWVDVLPYFRRTRSLVLAWRCILPMNEGPWEFGGRRLVGESRKAAAIRHFCDDTSLVVSESRLEYLDSPDFIYANRQQEPQNVPVHGIIHTFALEVTAEEINTMAANLNTKEYKPGSVDFYNWPNLQAGNIHPSLRDHYNMIFADAA